MPILLTVVLLAVVPEVMAADAPDTSTWVQFASFTYTGKAAATLVIEEYLNPIISGFYPDPSICWAATTTWPIPPSITSPASPSGTPRIWSASVTH